MSKIAQPKVIELTLDDVGYNGVTKRDIGKLMLVWPNGCTDITSKYEPINRNWLGHVIYENGGRYSHHHKNDDGDLVFYCDILPDNVAALFPQAIVISRGDYVRSKLVFPKNTRLKTLRTTYKGVRLYA
jgi:hypothetical protein